MEIIIQRTNPDVVLQQANSFWKFYIKKFIFLYTLFGIIGITIVITSENFELANYSNLDNLFSGIGSGLILLSVILFAQTRNVKEKYDLGTKKTIHALRRNNTQIEIKITDKTIQYQDFEIKSEVKWSYFSNYKFYKDYLFLMTAGNDRGIIISKKEMSPDQFKQLSHFVSKYLKASR